MYENAVTGVSDQIYIAQIDDPESATTITSYAISNYQSYKVYSNSAFLISDTEFLIMGYLQNSNPKTIGFLLSNVNHTSK